MVQNCKILIYIQIRWWEFIKERCREETRLLDIRICEKCKRQVDLEI